MHDNVQIMNISITIGQNQASSLNLWSLASSGEAKAMFL